MREITVTALRPERFDRRRSADFRPNVTLAIATGDVDPTMRALLLRLRGLRFGNDDNNNNNINDMFVCACLLKRRKHRERKLLRKSRRLVGADIYLRELMDLILLSINDINRHNTVASEYTLKSHHTGHLLAQTRARARRLDY